MSSAASRNGEVGGQFCRFYLFVLIFGVFRIFVDYELVPGGFDVFLGDFALEIYDIAMDTVNGELDLSIEEYENDFIIEEDNQMVPPTRKTTVAYAVTITKLRSGKNMPNTTLFDRAAVLHRSIQNAMGQSSRYDYHLYAFVHPDAIEVQPRMEQLGYRVLVRETPVNITRSQNKALIEAQGSGCCGDKEYLKLYSFLLLNYPVVVHVDMDYLVLKPMDDIFDLMTDPSYDRSKFQYASMWTDMKAYNGSIDFLFTRDYNMVNPPKRQPHQIGVQGGFLVVRPSREEFDKFVSIIESGGNFENGHGWGGAKLKYGGYYGHGTIQGFASYYYGHLEPNRAIELNRCYYNTMVDNPIHHDKNTNISMCRTMEPDLSCQDCRKTKVEDIYSVHFTVCGKPEHCALEHPVPLCRNLFEYWHKFRSTLEEEWINKFPGYNPGVAEIPGNATEAESMMKTKFGGHCEPKYIPMIFPSETDKLI